MAARRLPGLTAAEARRFGIVVGGAAMALAAVLWWRGRPAGAGTLAAIGLVLSAAGAIAPARLVPLARAWMALAHALSRVTTPVIMTAIYLAVITPVGLARRLFGGNPLVHRERGGTYWKERPPGARRSDLRRQF